MTIMYVIASIILLIALYSIYKHARLVLGVWSEVTGVSSKIMSALALITCACAIVCWLFLIYCTYSSWQIYLDPSRPKPFFLVIYVLGLFVVGISMSLSQLFFSLSKLKNDTD
jgi:hypothetical protein